MADILEDIQTHEQNSEDGRRRFALQKFQKFCGIDNTENATEEEMLWALAGFRWLERSYPQELRMIRNEKTDDNAYSHVGARINSYLGESLEDIDDILNPQNIHKKKKPKSVFNLFGKLNFHVLNILSDTVETRESFGEFQNDSFLLFAEANTVEDVLRDKLEGRKFQPEDYQDFRNILGNTVYMPLIAVMKAANEYITQYSAKVMEDSAKRINGRKGILLPQQKEI